MDDQTKLYKKIFIVLNLFFIMNSYSLFTQSIITWNISGVGNILLSLAMFFVGCMGYNAAITNDYQKMCRYKTILMVYTICCTIFFIIMVLGLTVNKSTYTAAVEKFVLNPMYKSIHKDEVRRSIDIMQIGYKCCGIQGPEGKEVEEENGIRLMHSCCSTTVALCTKEAAYTLGCSSPVIDLMRQTGLMYTLAIAFDIILKVFAIILAIALAKSMAP